MTAQVTAGQPITVVARSVTGGFIPNATFTTDTPIYTDRDLNSPHDGQANGAGELRFYAPAGAVVVVTCDDPVAVDFEPIQVVGTAARPGGLAAVHPDDTPAVHDTSPVSQTVTDASLVGVPSVPLPEDQGGALAAVGVDRAQNVPPTDEPAATPDGTTATDPDATSDPASQPDQVTPQFEQVPVENATVLQPVEITSTAGEQPA